MRLNEDPNESASRRISEAVEALSEGFSSVQIFATKAMPDGGVAGFRSGVGNIYERFGVVAEWLQDGVNQRGED